MNENVTPLPIKFDSTVLDLAFHPSEDLIVTGNIDGNVLLYSYCIGSECKLQLALSAHDQACRTVQFISDGKKVCTASKDASLKVFNLETVEELHLLKNSNGTSIYSMLVIDANIIAAGDDDGRISLWDLRNNKLIMDIKENDDFISDMIIDDNHKILLTTSGDGTLSAFDIRKHKLKVQSELFDSDLLSLAVVKNGTKVVCGTGEGVLNIFNWGEWGNISDRFPGHPMSVDCLQSISDSVVCTGSSDGLIRAVKLFPHQFLGVVGEHEDFLIESMSLSCCGKLLATSSHDDVVKFWNVDSNNISKLSKQRGKRKAKTKKGEKTITSRILHSAAAQRKAFFADMADSGNLNSNTCQQDNNDNGDSLADSDSWNTVSDSDSDSD